MPPGCDNSGSAAASHGTNETCQPVVHWNTLMSLTWTQYVMLGHHLFPWVVPQPETWNEAPLTIQQELTWMTWYDYQMLGHQMFPWMPPPKEGTEPVPGPKEMDDEYMTAQVEPEPEEAAEPAADFAAPSTSGP